MGNCAGTLNVLDCMPNRHASLHTNQSNWYVNSAGEARMVSVGDKKSTERRALAQGVIKMNPSTIDAISDNSSKKGDVLAVARIAGIQGN